MGGENNTQWKWVERWSPTLFVVGGLLNAGHAAMMGVEAFTEVATPPDVFAPTASILVFAGLFGVYRTLANRVPTTARVGAACVAVGIVAFSAITVGKFAELVGYQPPGWFAVFTLPAIVGMVPGFALYGIASYRAGVHSRTLSLLLLAPAALFLGLMASVIVLGVSALGGLVVGSGLTLVYLSTGYSLRTGPPSTERVPSTGDVAAG